VAVTLTTRQIAVAAVRDYFAPIAALRALLRDRTAPWSLILRRYWRFLRGRCWSCGRPLAAHRAPVGSVWRYWPNHDCCHDCNKRWGHAQSYGMAPERREDLT
jgi:hypothetical protein